MRNDSRFARTTVAAALVAATGAATLGITSFVSAEIQDPENPAVVVDEGGNTGTTGAEPVVEPITPASPLPADESNDTTMIMRRTSPIAVAATALGMTAEELLAELKDGKSIADVASAKKVEIDKVVDALYAHMASRLGAHVSEGRLTQEQADAKLAGAREKITAMVNRTGLPMGKEHKGMGKGRKGMGGMRGHGDHGDMGDHSGRHGGRHGGGMGRFGPGAPSDGATTESAAFSA